MWERIRDEVLERIQNRVWRPGDLIPNEEDLAVEFGCARATINRALRQLSDDGFLERKRKAGTRVALTPVRHARLSIPIIKDEIESSGANYSYALIHRGIAVVPTHLALRLKMDSALCVQALHLSDGQPYLYEDRWISSTALPDVLQESFENISANEWLVRNATYSEGEIAFQAEAATKRDSEILNVKEGAPLFVLERTTRGDEGVITWVRMAYLPGHRMVSPI